MFPENPNAFRSKTDSPQNKCYTGKVEETLLHNRYTLNKKDIRFKMFECSVQVSCFL